MNEDYILDFDGKNPHFEDYHQIGFKIYNIIDNVRDRNIVPKHCDDQSFAKLCESIRKIAFLHRLFLEE